MSVLKKDIQKQLTKMIEENGLYVVVKAIDQIALERCKQGDADVSYHADAIAIFKCLNEMTNLLPSRKEPR